ncbi:MAG TPA: hypothetical protein PKN69_06085, partial [Candidatus Latescibacteria bacterium]|nr:hypothetical protein [Candidatus Latescibacterota bacterium]
TGVEPWPQQPAETDIPDPDITISTMAHRDSYEITYAFSAGTSFADYLVAVWDIPRECRDWRLETNAKEFIWIENTDGNFRGIVRFDLEPECTISVRWHGNS